MRAFFRIPPSLSSGFFTKRKALTTSAFSKARNDPPARPEIMHFCDGNHSANKAAPMAGALLANLNWHGAELRSMALTPDGTRLLTASKDGSARVWELFPARGDVGSAKALPLAA